MKKLLLIQFLLVISIAISAQSMLKYNFNGSLNEANAASPALTVLGIQGNFITDTLSEIEDNNKTVYRFEKNNGVQFNNVAAGNFLGETYTIELYFVFDELTSWTRVVDWKNRKTDAGAYVYYGQLNFYPYIYSEEAPVKTGEYTYYVITRDSASKNVLIYTDAEVKINFTDNNDAAVIDGDGVLNFFYDDLSVSNEASAGAVAMLRLYNYALDSSSISDNWVQLGSNVLGLSEKTKSTVKVKAFPNPASEYIQLNFSAFTQKEDLLLRIVNQTGQIVFTDKVKINNADYSVPVNTLKKGLYVLCVESQNEVARTKFLVN